MSKSGWSGLPVASSIEPPTRPTPAAQRMVSAASLGESPKPFSRSAATGRSVAFGDQARIGQGLVARHATNRACPARPPWRRASSPARLATRGRPARARARILWIGNDEGTRSVMQHMELTGLFGLADTHGRSPTRNTGRSLSRPFSAGQSRLFQLRPLARQARRMGSGYTGPPCSTGASRRARA